MNFLKGVFGMMPLDPCKIKCQKLSTSVYNMKLHRRLTHSRENLHKYTSGSKELTTKQGLANHDVIYIGERLFQRQQCGDDSNQAANLRTHAKKTWKY